MAILSNRTIRRLTRSGGDYGRISERCQLSIRFDRPVEHDGKQIAGIGGSCAAGASSGSLAGSICGEQFTDLVTQPVSGRVSASSISAHLFQLLNGIGLHLVHRLLV